MLNGAKYTLFGCVFFCPKQKVYNRYFRSNAYWPALLGYSSIEIDQAFADIVGSGATTVR
jgi:hypothetical protein